MSYCLSLHLKVMSSEGHWWLRNNYRLGNVGRRERSMGTRSWWWSSLPSTRGIEKEEHWPFFPLSDSETCQNHFASDTISLSIIVKEVTPDFSQERKPKGKNPWFQQVYQGFISKFIGDLSVLGLNCLSFYLGHLRPPACLLPLQFRQ